ncbi:hypothetical protein A9798_05845 [Edwardsiella hoshinae]|uniref:Inner membrane protein ybjM n=1 Tax=Edwardsiella hoshinae TaxID=93378 RepID=A0A376DC80_9GAMM|nr:inner membrane protein YbjM [Edwardsiella hoshinae]AOV96516.1 hypothetical protein A9798_05845 [Edwardsiella hoshinae]QPR27591.1 inner membrane protein YbjM [Edwardsiella hoshinae]STC86755.1 Inner membrane protein ybjM [Edwardsiella hoshinae]
MANRRRWFSLILCFFLVTALFFLLHGYSQPNGDGGASLPGMRPGLLLYMLPGAIACPLAQRYRVLTVFYGASAAALCCLLLHTQWLACEVNVLQMLPYSASMVFWCVFGALLYWFTAVMRGQHAIR